MQKTMVTHYNSKEELEKARLVEAANTSYSERFYTLMKLIKVSIMIKNAKIIHNPKMIESNK